MRKFLSPDWKYFPRKHNQEFDYVLTALQSLYDKEHFKNKQALGDWEIVIQRQTALHMMIYSILTSTVYSNRPNWMGGTSAYLDTIIVN